MGISGGFFGLAFMSGFSVLVYLGAVSMATAVVLTGIGLLRGREALDNS
jgi:NADH:ubiquinone oxidoreductase subunit 6 (subunit J)